LFDSVPKGDSLSPVDRVIGRHGRTFRNFFAGDGGAAAEAATPHCESNEEEKKRQTEAGGPKATRFRLVELVPQGARRTFVP
jgi:hypothetical protein